METGSGAHNELLMTRCLTKETFSLKMIIFTKGYPSLDGVCFRSFTWLRSEGTTVDKASFVMRPTVCHRSCFINIKFSYGYAPLGRDASPASIVSASLVLGASCKTRPTR